MNNTVVASPRGFIAVIENNYNEDGSIACEAEGGHAMTVTGVTDDRLLIVSSWGDKYYVDPQCDSTISYQQVTYK